MEKITSTMTEKAWNGLYSLADDEHSVTEGGGGVGSAWQKAEREKTCVFRSTKL